MPNKLAAVKGTLMLLSLLALLVGTSIRFDFGIGLMTFGGAALVVYFWNTRGANVHGPG
jgi:hypothetical protein